MARLFGRNLVKQLAGRISTEEIADHLVTVRRWVDDYHQGSLRKDNETSREQQYNQDFFMKVLDYREKPAQPYSFVPKAKSFSGQQPDALLSYSLDADLVHNVAAVVELKGASVDLDRPQQRQGNLTPVQQGFKYKPLYPHCPFVVVSNFYEFRLYHDNQLDFEVWTLDNLVDPAEDYLAFKTWYILLCKNSLTAIRGQSATESMITDIRIEQETIGKKFYDQYRDARLELLRDLYRRNASVRADLNLGIEKAQKIIDRTVFTCFAEDRGLLPDNTLARVVRYADSGYGTLWSNLQGFFRAVDLGSGRLGIPTGYNGGLFREDLILNGLEIGEEPLRRLTNLSGYDFKNDLSVTVLGHIFEQSITELEEIKEKAAESRKLELSASYRRKRDGIFYTPDYVVRYIIDRSLGEYLREHEELFRKQENLKENVTEANYARRERRAYEKYQKFLQNIKVLDPACGSGAFLVHVFDYLMAENQRVGAILGDLFSMDEYVRHILKDNIFGVDLNEESIEISQLSIWLKSAKKGERLISLEKNIRVGNSLISDPRIIDGRPFDWKTAFPGIIRDGGFDVVVGNPPYGAKVSEAHRRHLEHIYDTYEYQFNSYALFYERALGLLKPGGVLGFITPATFTYQHYFRKLREFLQKFEHDSITKYIYEVFGDADIGDSVVWVCRNSPNLKKLIKVAICDSPKVYSPPLVYRPYEDVINDDGSYDLRVSALNLKRISKLAQLLGQLAKVTVGIKPYQTGKGEPKQTVVDVLEKPFTANYAVDNSFRPCMIGRDFHRYRLLKRPMMYLSYGKWLAEPRESAPFGAAKKIVIRQTADSLIGYLDTEQRINLNNVYNIAPTSVDLRAEYLLALINSKLLNYIYQGISQEKGRTFAEVKRVYLAQLPIIIADEATQDIISDMVNQLISLHETIFEESESFRVLVKSEYGAGVWSSAVNSWWEMDFTEFAGRLKRRLSLRQKKDLLELYQAYQPKLTQAAQLTQDVLARIEAAVFDVYGLTPEEITIIEQGALP